MRIVLSNVGADQAQDLARKLVEERAAACVTLLAGRSIYRWEGAVCEEPETTLMIKVSAEATEALVRRLGELHPYDVPEIVVLEVDSGASLEGYVSWVRDNTAPANSTG